MSTSDTTGRGRVAGLDHVELGVPDLEAAVAFYRDVWGLRLISDEIGGGRAGLATTGADRPDLWLRRQPIADLVSIGMAVADVEELDRLSADLRRQARPESMSPLMAVARRSRIPTRTASFWRSRTPQGRAVAVLRWTSPPLQGRPPGPAHRPPPPWRASTPRLGFHVTDRTTAGMSFFRCAADHHTLAFFASGDGGLQHLAFDVATTDAVMSGVAQLREHGVHPIWGPGRHGPGDNVFAYFEDPAGHIIEYFGDLETFAVDDWPEEPRFWGPEHRGDRWGLAGPPPPQFGRGRPSGATSKPSGGEG